MRVNYRAGDMFAPHLDNTEALRTEALEFVDSIERGRKPLTDGQAGLRVVEILEAATQSLKRRGGVIELDLVGRQSTTPVDAGQLAALALAVDNRESPLVEQADGRLVQVR
jgi:hypothetical protein